ncbi:MAG: DUF5119 domain-containing protein [Bacteroidaceae bacterium]|nr:DUF5119 domain-containing protein [Bacteroidaceae bacterium]
MNIIKNLGYIKQLISVSLFILMFVLTGCEHRPLVELTNRRYIRIYLDEHIRNVSYGFYDETKKKPEYKTPKVLRVTLSNTTTGEVMGEDYLQESGTDERGNYIHGYVNVPPGTYNLLAYNFDTESTHVKYQNDYERMEVYTNPVSEELRNRLQSVRSVEESRAEVVRYEPDHFFVTTIDDVTLETVAGNDTIWAGHREHPVAESVVKTYYMQVNVKGVEHVRSAVALITGMAGSVTLHNRAMVTENPSTIYFNLRNGRAASKGGEEITTIGYSTFNTFGKLPEVEGYIEITFEFHTTDDRVQTETIRVTDMFETEQVKEKQWIIIDKVIEIVPPEGAETGGGMSPGVSQWEQIEGSITI